MSSYREIGGRGLVWRFFTWGDIASVVLILSVAAIGIFVRNPSVEAPIVKVFSKNGEESFVLAQANRRIYDGPLGETVVEKNSEGVRISKSPCAKQICVGQGPIKFAGELIACVPNQVVVTLSGKLELYDALSR